MPPTKTNQGTLFSRYHLPWHQPILGGGFKYLLFSPLPGEMIQIDEHIFQMGWNHQLVNQFHQFPFGFLHLIFTLHESRFSLGPIFRFDSCTWKNLATGSHQMKKRFEANVPYFFYPNKQLEPEVLIQKKTWKGTKVFMTQKGSSVVFFSKLYRHLQKKHSFSRWTR